MSCVVKFHDEFEPEFDELPEPVREELLGQLIRLREFGHTLGRPAVDTLNGSVHKNMKELRFQKDGVWRFAFAFDPIQQGIVLCGGDKEGENTRRFYASLIKKADARFDKHLASLKVVSSGPTVQRTRR